MQLETWTLQLFLREAEGRRRCLHRSSMRLETKTLQLFLRTAGTMKTLPSFLRAAPPEDKNVSLGSTIGTSLGRGNVGCNLLPDALGEERRLLVLFSLLIETASSVGPDT
jgi:hypothetical protein